MSIAKRIKEIKLTLHLTSSELAQQLDIPVRTIGSYERGEAQPSPKFMIALFEKLHIDINWLLSGKGNMFLDKKAELDIGYMAGLQERLNLTNDQIVSLIELFDCAASREMVLRFIEIKKGNKVALDSLLCNLQGIKAIYG